MSFVLDNLLGLLDGTANVTASSTAATNSRRVPPGLYDVVVEVPTVPTGTTPTMSIEIMDSVDGITFNSLAEQRLYNASPTAKGQYVFHGVRIVRQAAIGVTANNVGANVTVGGTAPNFGKVLCYIMPVGNGTGFQGTP